MAIRECAARGADELGPPDRAAIEIADQVAVREIAFADPARERIPPLEHGRGARAEERLEIIEVLLLVGPPQAIAFL